MKRLNIKERRAAAVSFYFLSKRFLESEPFPFSRQYVTEAAERPILSHIQLIWDEFYQWFINIRFDFEVSSTGIMTRAHCGVSCFKMNTFRTTDIATTDL